MTNETFSLSMPDWLDEYSGCIESEVLTRYGKGNTDLEKVALEAVSKGKRIRAVLALLWCEALGEDYSIAAPVAVAYELAHAAALVQDDIIDDSSLRRGEKSIFGKYGVAGAILASNTLLFQVPNLLAECGRKGADSPTMSKLLDLLGDCYRSATLGEYMDLEMAGRSNVTEADYNEMIRLKTGALIAASSASGALMGNPKDTAAINSAFSFGELLGMAYQIQDDILDIMGDESVIGKPVFTDIKRGKKSLVLIHFLNHCTNSESEFIRSLFARSGSYDRAEVEKTKALLEKYESATYSQKVAFHYVNRAEKLLMSLEESKARDRLLELSGYLAMRKY